MTDDEAELASLDELALEAPPGHEAIVQTNSFNAPEMYAAYGAGLFPMGAREDGGPPYVWFSPDPRGVLEPCAAHVSRSLKRQMRDMTITINTDFAAVVERCGDKRRDGYWITPEFEREYLRLHDVGLAWSVEVHRHGELVGGLFGVSVGSLFCGESMFHSVSGASKVALAAASCVVATVPKPLFDVQWSTPHLATLGVIDMPRTEYIPRVLQAKSGPAPNVRRFTRGGPYVLQADGSQGMLVPISKT